MRLPRSWLAFLVSAVPLSAVAAEKWETCLDKADFSYNSDESILSGTTTSISKTGCKFVFSILGGKGEKFEVDVCDPLIHVDHFANLESAGHRITADTAGCPAPGFGADFEANAKQFNEYRNARSRVFGLLDKVRNFYAEELTKANITAPYDKANIAALETKNDTKDSQERRDAKLTAGREGCAQFLLKEYLQRCMSFEARKSEPGSVAPATGPDTLIGVHPQTVPKK